MAPGAGRMPTVFVTHGGGPMPLLGDPAHKDLIASLRQLPTLVPRPRAVVVVSAHWEAPQPKVLAAASPGMLYDYHGFPPEAYQLKYPAPGSPHNAEKVLELLRGAGFEAEADTTGRGFDHGMFVPLMLSYPDADIPVVGLSILSSLSPQDHVRMGRALQPLRDEGVLILASGSSFHNMSALVRAIMRAQRGQPGGSPPNERAVGQDFDDYLVHAATTLVGHERDEALQEWAAAPGGREAHPREEHLMPLLVAAAAGGSSPGTALRMRLAGVATSHVVFGGVG